MVQYFWRALIAAIACVLVFALIPPLSNVFGFEVSGSLWQVIKICVAAIAVFFVIGGPPVNWFNRP